MTDLSVPTKTLPQALRDHARRTPDAVAIRQKRFGIWSPTTWAGYWARAKRIGMGLRALGVEKGAHIGVLSENRVEWVLAQMGGPVSADSLRLTPFTLAASMRVQDSLEQGVSFFTR